MHGHTSIHLYKQVTMCVEARMHWILLELEVEAVMGHLRMWLLTTLLLKSHQNQNLKLFNREFAQSPRVQW